MDRWPSATMIWNLWKSQAQFRTELDNSAQHNQNSEVGSDVWASADGVARADAGGS